MQLVRLDEACGPKKVMLPGSGYARNGREDSSRAIADRAPPEPTCVTVRIGLTRAHAVTRYEGPKSSIDGAEAFDVVIVGRGAVGCVIAAPPPRHTPVQCVSLKPALTSEPTCPRHSGSGADRT